MKNQKAFIWPSGCSCLPVVKQGLFAVLFLVLFILPRTAYSQAEETYDEISIVLNVQRVGSIEIPGIIHNQEIYLPIKEIFDFLKIKNILSQEVDSIYGYFINPQAPYNIDMANSRIIYQGKTTALDKADLMRTDNNLYMRSAYFGSIFGLDCVFNFRNLSVTLTTKIELPAIREMQQALMRNNIARLKGEKKVDQVIDRKFSWFHLGMADWYVVNNLQENGKLNTTVNLALGAVVAGGEANLYLNYDKGRELNIKDQYYNWKYVNNNNSIIRQVTAGKLFVQSTASLFAPVTGVQISNAPTTYRRSFGTYTLSNTTEPGWIVELYINNVLVNYMKADASGFYSFEVPLVYGSSAVKLRFYGPWGEERTSEKYISVPFNFIPEEQLEYSITGGVVGDDNKSRFARANLNYGLSKRITIGGGMEYLSSLTTGKFLPYLNASARIGSGLLISAERTHRVRSVGMISYHRPSSLQVDFNYTSYDKGQTAVKNNYQEEKKLVVSMPFRGKKYSLLTRLTVDQITLVKSKYTSAELLLSGVMAGISSNLTTYAVLTDKKPLVFSTFSMNLRLPGKIRFTPQVQYEYRQKTFSMLRGEVEKAIFNKGYINFTYEKNLVTKNELFGIGLRYNFSFAQAFFSASRNNGANSMVQSARGSLIYDHASNYFGASSLNTVGRGGLLIMPYLDLNCNGERDENEPKVADLNLRINGGRIERNKRDTSIRVMGLEAYNSYYIELDKNTFENIAWQIKNKIIKVTVDANQLKMLEVPVTVMGEVSGSVLLNKGEGLVGQGRIIINIFNSRSKLVTKIITEPDGYFNYMGLPPGKYTAIVDAAQLSKLNMSCAPTNASFTIKPKIEGDIIDNVQFVLKTNNNKENK